MQLGSDFGTRTISLKSIGNTSSELTTGFKSLDLMTKGLKGGQVFVIAARAAIGRMALAMGIVEHSAIANSKAVLIYSLALSAEQLSLRMLCSLAGVHAELIQNGLMGKTSLQKVADTAKRIEKARIFINDAPILNILELRANARRFFTERPLDLIIVDSFNIVKPLPRGVQGSRYTEFTEVSSELKAVARELDIPIIVLLELDELPETEEAKSNAKPKLSELCKFGSIKQDADVIGLLWREFDHIDNSEDRTNSNCKAHLIVAKNHRGNTGKVNLTYKPDINRFEEVGSEKTGIRISLLDSNRSAGEI